jgi:hypothetical protein
MVTLSGDQVPSLGSSGVVIQAPSGVLSTIVLYPTPAVEIAPEATKGNEGDTIAATSTSSGGSSSTDLGEIIYTTFEGRSSRPMAVGFLGLLGSAILGMLMAV